MTGLLSVKILVPNEPDFLAIRRRLNQLFPKIYPVEHHSSLPDVFVPMTKGMTVWWIDQSYFDHENHPFLKGLLASNEPYIVLVEKEQDAYRMRKKNAFHCISKPITIEELAICVSKLLEYRVISFVA